MNDGIVVWGSWMKRLHLPPYDDEPKGTFLHQMTVMLSYDTIKVLITPIYVLNRTT